MTRPTDRAAKARDAHMRNAAERAADDPAKLHKALRTVIAGAPRLTNEQVERLRALLPPANANNGDG